MAMTKGKVRVDFNGAEPKNQPILSELREMNKHLINQNYRLKNIQSNTMIAGAFVVFGVLILFATLVVGLDAVSTAVYTEM